MDLIKSIRDSIRAIPDYPKPGITFRDISPLLQSKDAFKSTIEAFAQRYQELGIDQIAAVEARGRAQKRYTGIGGRSARLYFWCSTCATARLWADFVA